LLWRGARFGLALDDAVDAEGLGGGGGRSNGRNGQREAGADGTHYRRNVGEAAGGVRTDGLTGCEGTIQFGQAVQLFVDVLGKLEAFSPSKKTAVFEHVESRRVQRPEGALPGPVRPSGDLDEAVVEGEVVAEGVLPSLRVPAVVRKPVGDESVDF
jgi:hypothetical protein